jgi:hypothetical protein
MLIIFITLRVLATLVCAVDVQITFSVTNALGYATKHSVLLRGLGQAFVGYYSESA